MRENELYSIRSTNDEISTVIDNLSRLAQERAWLLSRIYPIQYRLQVLHDELQDCIDSEAITLMGCTEVYCPPEKYADCEGGSSYDT